MRYSSPLFILNGISKIEEIKQFQNWKDVYVHILQMSRRTLSTKGTPLVPSTPTRVKMLKRRHINKENIFLKS